MVGRRVFSLLLCASLVGIQAVAEAQESWEKHLLASQAALARGDRDRAESELRRALEIAHSFPPRDPRLETSLERLAQLLEAEERLDEAQPQYELLVAAREYRVGPQSPELLPALAAAGRVALRAADIATGEDQLLRYAAIAEATGAAPPAEHWRILSLLSRTLVLQGRGDEALPYQQRVVSVIAGDADAGFASRVDALHTLAELEAEHGDPEAATALERQAEELAAPDDCDPTG